MTRTKKPTKNGTQSPARPKRAGATAARTKKPAAKAAAPRLYSMAVSIMSGPITEKFAKKNPVIERTIEIRGDQTLDDLHNAIFAAFDRWEEHMYEFQFGKRPMDPKAPRYVRPNPFGDGWGHDDDGVAGETDSTTIESLGLKAGRSFGYWFDFGDDWWHQIDVEAIEDAVPKGKFPRVTQKVGKSPPQYAEIDE